MLVQQCFSMLVRWISHIPPCRLSLSLWQEMGSSNHPAVLQQCEWCRQCFSKSIKDLEKKILLPNTVVRQRCLWGVRWQEHAVQTCLKEPQARPQRSSMQAALRPRFRLSHSMMFTPRGSSSSVPWLSSDVQLWLKTMWQNPQRQLEKPPDVRHLPPATHLPRSCQPCTCCQTLPCAPNWVYLCFLPASSRFCWRFICITCLVCFSPKTLLWDCVSDLRLLSSLCLFILRLSLSSGWVFCCLVFSSYLTQPFRNHKPYWVDRQFL